MVEFAIVAPLIALFLVIAIDFGRAFFSYVQITNGAREAAALGGGSLNGPTDLGAMRNRVLQEANVQDHGGEDSTIRITAECHNTAGATIACADSTKGSGAGNTVTVTVTRDFSLLTPLAGAILGDNFQMRVKATAPVLGFAAADSGGGGGGGTCPAPTAAFSVTVRSGRTVEVDPSASTPQVIGGICNLAGFFWYWGDPANSDTVGQASAAQFTYPNDGTYTIRLEVTNSAGMASTTRQVTVPAGAPVVCVPPDARFTFTTTGHGSHRSFTYIDQSTVIDEANCPITAWLWTFHDKSGDQQSNAQFPAPFQYDSSGSKSVTLRVTNAGGSNSLTKSTP